MRVKGLLVGGVAVLFLSCLAVGCGGSGGGGGNDGGGTGGTGTSDAGGGGNGGGDAGFNGGNQDGGTVTDGGTTGSDGGTVTDGGTTGTDGGTTGADGGTCSTSPCTLVAPQCGCGSNQACLPSSNGNVCTGAGTLTEGQACANPTDCVAGLICIAVSQGSSPPHLCARFCNADSDCQGAGSVCVHNLTSSGGSTIAQVCSVACDPIAGTGCATGTECIIAQEQSGNQAIFTDCAAPVGTGTQGQTCSKLTDCAQGYGCVGGKCMQYCTGPGKSGTAAGCAAGVTCAGLSTPLTIGSTTYGVCNP